MRYPVVYEKDGEGYLARFPDIPEALTGGDSLEEVQSLAQDALITAFDFYVEDGRPVPGPGLPTSDYVTVPASIAAKVLLLNAILDADISYAELARRMGKQPQAVQRLVDLHHTTKIDTIEEALTLLDKELQLVAL